MQVAAYRNTERGAKFQSSVKGIAAATALESKVAFLEQRKRELGAELTTMVKAREKASARLEYERKMAIARIERDTAALRANVVELEERREKLHIELRGMMREKYGPHQQMMAPLAKRICRVFGLTISDIRGRSNRNSFARHAFMYWARRRTDASSSQIGRWLGGRDHSTVLHGKTAYVKKRAAMGRKLREV